MAAGERYHSKWEFRELIENRYVNYIRPDICHCGGITEMRKIAALAETHYVSVVPHNNAGPLGTAASVHVSLALANVVLLEAPWANRDRSDIVSPFAKVEDGYAFPLEGPGLGIEFDEDAARANVFKPKALPKLDALDGSVMDW